MTDKIISIILSLLIVMCLFGCTPSNRAADGSKSSDTADQTTEFIATDCGNIAQTTTNPPDASEPLIELKTVGDLQYYLYTPASPTAEMPLIVYLHGGTNKRADVGALLTTDGFPKYLNDGYYGDLRAFVAIPKLDNDYNSWVSVSDKIADMISIIGDEYCIDLRRVALTGHSLGGTGTYQLQIRLPDTFACIAPMSGSVKLTHENVSLLGMTKIWAFIGTDDNVVDPESSREAVAALEAIGTDAKITELQGATHRDVPQLAYKNPELIAWLVSCGD